MVERCEKSGKIKIANLEKADDMILRTQMVRGLNGAMRAYRCGHCRSYHLTHQVNGSNRNTAIKVPLVHFDKWSKFLKANQDETLGTK